MKARIQDRCIRVAEYIIQERCTVRQAAKMFGVSKTTVHNDMVNRLLLINCGLHEEVRKVLDINKRERYLRGGEATRRKYLSR